MFTNDKYIKFTVFSNVGFLGLILEIWISNIIPKYQDILYAEYMKKTRLKFEDWAGAARGIYNFHQIAAFSKSFT